MHLLLAEYNRDLAQSLSRSLREEGFSVSIATDGEDAIHRIKTQTFDVAIVDWMMPAATGLDVVKAARASGAVLPILMLTGRDTAQDVVRGQYRRRRLSHQAVPLRSPPGTRARHCAAQRHAARFDAQFRRHFPRPYHA